MLIRLERLELLDGLLHFLIFSVQLRIILLALLLRRAPRRAPARCIEARPLDRRVSSFSFRTAFLTLSRVLRDAALRCALHDGFVARFEIEGQEVILEVYFELIDEEV